MEDQAVYFTKNNNIKPGDVLPTLRDEITKCISKYEDFRESFGLFAIRLKKFYQIQTEGSFTEYLQK